MKKTFRSILIGLLALPALASAQFSTNVAGGGGDTKLAIKQTAATAADLVFTNVQLVYLDSDPKIAGVTSKKDVSGKGNVWIVSPTAAAIPGLEICLSGVGRGGYAVVQGAVDKEKVKCAPASGAITLPITVSDDGLSECIGFTLLAVKDGVVVKNVWPSHPGGASKIMAKRAGGANDMVTLLCIDKSRGGIVLPSTKQVEAYKPLYTKVTAAE